MVFAEQPFDHRGITLDDGNVKNIFPEIDLNKLFSDADRSGTAVVYRFVVGLRDNLWKPLEKITSDVQVSIRATDE